MRFLEAKGKKRGDEENKMQTGSRSDQRSVSPQVLAQQLGVKIEDVTGSGDNGEVTLKDIRAHAKKNTEANQKNPPVSGVTRPSSR